MICALRQRCAPNNSPIDPSAAPQWAAGRADIVLENGSIIARGRVSDHFHQFGWTASILTCIRCLWTARRAIGAGRRRTKQKGRSIFCTELGSNWDRAPVPAVSLVHLPISIFVRLQLLVLLQWRQEFVLILGNRSMASSDDIPRRSS